MPKLMEADVQFVSDFVYVFYKHMMCQSLIKSLAYPKKKKKLIKSLNMVVSKCRLCLLVGYKIYLETLQNIPAK